MTLISLSPLWEMTVVLKGKQAVHCRAAITSHYYLTHLKAYSSLLWRKQGSAVQCGVSETGSEALWWPTEGL